MSRARSRWRILALVATLALAAGALALAASAAQAPSLTVEDARVRGGEELVLRGRGFAPDVHVTLLAGRTRAGAKRIGAARTGRRGGFVARVEIEAGAKPGRYLAVACHDRCRSEATVRFRILQP